MAKSVRASVSKRNKANLRAKVFGPAVDARTERLSAKLLELASQPKPDVHEEKSKSPERSEDMDLDKGQATDGQSRSNTAKRIHKRHSNRKNRSSIVFRPHSSKGKTGSKRK
ncbi:hypothetical protein FE257_002605 [Aspergillus nanangensis]|uniref:DUF2423 domain-containing protein n=1 Tax=Aspergillus nanangensis TaxID=2582783 RepID=A0AAD4GVY9_ASPNN|nr:hypothetical protein FE257_002605 [Aspergillus nanangensis]